VTRVAILDYGVGNLFSLTIALGRESAASEIVKSIPDPFGFDALILPGVGGFGPVAERIRDERSRLAALIDRRMPILGICLGLQLMLNSSEEGDGEGLGFLTGSVKRLPSSVKVPHIGWNQLQPVRPSRILAGLDSGAWVYYVHSYYPEVDDASGIVASSDYGLTFTSVVEKESLFGTQFHPEKSGEAGSRIIRNFLQAARSQHG
jgi:glutamine amidotransferase